MKLSKLLQSPIGRFRIIAFLEGCSFLLLGFTMILKYQYDMPKPNYIVGMAHGLLFVLYIFLLIQVALRYSWRWSTIFFAFVASLFPTGTFIADAKIFKNYN